MNWKNRFLRWIDPNYFSKNERIDILARKVWQFDKRFNDLALKSETSWMRLTNDRSSLTENSEPGEVVIEIMCIKTIKP